MKLIILAAGEGVRMRPLTLDTPKPLLKVLGKPILDHIFLSLPDEITEVIIVVKYLQEKIRDYCGNEFYGRKIEYREGSSLGTAMSFLSTKDLLVNEDRFLFIHGDDLPYKTDIEHCLQYRTSCLCAEASDPWNSGVVIIDTEGYISKIIEKPINPPSNLVNNGVMVITNSIFECEPVLSEKHEYFFSEMFNQYLEKEDVVAVKAQYALGGFTAPDDIKKIEVEMAKRPAL